MKWELLTPKQYVTALWSGGSTTQLAISPEGAVYASRNFLWRISSATVEIEHSDFTALPDYHRFITVLDGSLDLKIGDGHRLTLRPMEIREFDGSTPVESWGQCTDFNLMLRKEKCCGILTTLCVSGHDIKPWPEAQRPADCVRRDLAVYCVSGEVRIPQDGASARDGQMLLCRDADQTPPAIEVTQGKILLSDIFIHPN